MLATAIFVRKYKRSSSDTEHRVMGEIFKSKEYRRASRARASSISHDCVNPVYSSTYEFEDSLPVNRPFVSKSVIVEEQKNPLFVSEIEPCDELEPTAISNPMFHSRVAPSVRDVHGACVDVSGNNVIGYSNEHLFVEETNHNSWVQNMFHRAKNLLSATKRNLMESGIGSHMVASTRSNSQDGTTTANVLYTGTVTRGHALDAVASEVKIAIVPSYGGAISTSNPIASMPRTKSFLEEITTAPNSRVKRLYSMVKRNSKA
jgi:hypothetical protein